MVQRPPRTRGVLPVLSGLCRRRLALSISMRPRLSPGKPTTTTRSRRPRRPKLSDSQTAVHVLKHHFRDMEQQNETSSFGMWVFLVTEIMFFGGLFCAYLIYRVLYF